MSRAHFATSAASLVGLVTALVALALTGTLPLLAWTERCTPVARYPALFAGFLATWLGLRLAHGPVARRAVLLGGSLACAAIFDPGLAVLSLAWIVLFHRVLFGGRRPRLAAAWTLCAVTWLGLAVACSRDLFPDLWQSRPWLARWGYVVAVMWSFRVLWLLHQVRVGAATRVPLVDPVTYLVFAPFYLIVPYMLAIPRLDRFVAGLERHDVAVERSGLRLLALGLALSLVEVGLARLYDPVALGVAAWERGDHALAVVHAALRYPPIAILRGCAIAAILIGLVRVLGFDLALPFERPWQARSILAWWQRWNLHFRDLLVDVFYLPVVMRHRRRPERAIVLGCLGVFLLGSVPLHALKTYFTHGHLLALPVGTLAESLVMAPVVAVALVTARRHPDRRPRPLRGLVVTWALVLGTVVVVGYGAQAAWNQHVAHLPLVTPRSTAHVFPATD